MNHQVLSEQRWQAIRREYPRLARELDALAVHDEEDVLLKIVYAGLDIHDIPSVEPQCLLEYVRASIRMRREIAYSQSVPDELFFDYVLPPRVNNEYLDGSRGWLFEQLKDRVYNKNMLDAALEVNYWCYEQATYQSTDDRTIGPLGMCRRAKGRCGEESTLLTAALRAVGIPARQVYVPLWAHCDDNHAWVEFWAEGAWHYMGACEPESVPDVGWFRSAASRAMLVRSRVPDFTADSGYRVVNSTARYADSAELRVIVQKVDCPVPGAQVRFQLINEAQIGTIHTEITDEQGSVSFTTGFGTLILSAFLDGRLIERVVDLRNSQEAVLRWEDGFDPLTEENTQEWELIPPKEKLPPYYEADKKHLHRLRQCENTRFNHEKTFPSAQWLDLARGNFREIERFLNLQGYSMEDKQSLLSTLAEKDFADVTCDTLEDHLDAALRWKESYPTEIWGKEILAPRVEHEMLLPVRKWIQKYFEADPFQSKQQVLSWMEQNLRRLPEYGLTDRRGNAAGYLRHGVCPESEWELLSVQICRALGISASLGSDPEHPVKLTFHSNEPLRWRENWSLARWEAGEYRNIEHPKDGMLEPGSYSLITARRQIDGTVNARVSRFILRKDREIELQIPVDRTAQKLKSVSMTSAAERPSLLIFLQPGTEPTEHLLRELLELKEEFSRGGWQMRFLLSDLEHSENETFRLVLMSIIGCTWDVFESFEHYRAQSAMDVGDARLPLAVVLDRAGKGVYACANYQIGSAHTMLRILKLIT